MFALMSKEKTIVFLTGVGLGNFPGHKSDVWPLKAASCYRSFSRDVITF